MRQLKILIVIFWLLTMFFLLKKEGYLSKTHNLTYYDILGKKDPYREEYLGIYLKKQRIGFSKSYIDAYSFPNHKVGFSISNQTRIFVKAFGEKNTIDSTTEILIDDRYRLYSFSFCLLSEQYKIEAKGERKHNKIIASLYSGGSLITRREFKEKPFVFGSFFLPLSSLSEGKVYCFNNFDPYGIIGEQRIKLEVKKRTTMMYNDELFEVYPIVLSSQNIKANIYATREGKILKAYLPQGIIAKAEDEKKVKTKFSYPDISLFASSPSNILLKEPRKVLWLKIKIKDEIRTIKKDVFPKKPYFLPIKEYLEYTKATPFVQSNDKRIVKAAKIITKGEKNSLKASILLMKWVYDNLEQKPVFSLLSSIEILKNKEGDCNEHAILFTALARSLGIPTKMITGLCYQEGRFYYHAWCKVFCGEWVSIDPTFNQAPVDATHIPLIEGDIEKQMGLLGLIGEIKIEVLEYGYN